MRRLQKSKSVSWASDGNLCQVKLFLSEDYPSQVGSSSQDHLQAKKSSSGLYVTGYGSGSGSDDNLPPGFEEFTPENQLKSKLAQIPLAKWRRPPRFLLNADWQVVAGVESEAAAIENRRELRVLEAIYPRSSAIPENAAVSLDVEKSYYDDQKTPLIPITPIEDEESATDVSSAPAAAAPTNAHATVFPQGTYQPSSQNNSISLPNPLGNGGPATNEQPGLVATLTAMARNIEQGSLIDHNLLRNIISNPTLLQGLLGRQGASPTLANGQAANATVSHVASFPPRHELSQPQFNKMDFGSSSVRPTSNIPFYPHSNGAAPPGFHPQPPAAPATAFQSPASPHGSVAPPAKDMNYYKSLIQQHGGDRPVDSAPPPYNNRQSYPQGAISELSDNSRPRDPKPKIMKPCIYFNSSKGCRNGASCIFQHDGSTQQRSSSIQDMQSAKKMKTDREFRGSQPYS